jgi:NDP-sugar pyrophosphorylase family protein
VKAIVLVGGEGTRLRPLTYTTPKQLLPVAEVRMLERVLAQLSAHGIDEAVLSLGYRPDAFLATYPDGMAAGVNLSYAVEPEPLDTAGAVLFAADQVGIDETFVVVNGDVLTDVDVSELVAFHHSSGAEATIHLTPVQDPSRFGVVPTDADGKVISFIEKPPAGQAPTNLINAGTYVLEPEVLARIPHGRRVSIERETFPALAADGVLYAQASGAYWLDTGTPDAYLRANFDLLDGTRGPFVASGARSVAEHVWVLGNPDLQGEVRPASLIGDRALVATGAVVHQSVIGAGCVVEPSASVEGSVLLPGATVCSRARVVGSIVGHNSHVGEGCTLEPVTVIGDAQTVPPSTRLSGARVPAEVAR